MPKFGDQTTLTFPPVLSPVEIPAEFAFRIAKILEAQSMIYRKVRELELEAYKLGYRFPDSLYLTLSELERAADHLHLVLRAENLAGRFHREDSTSTAQADSQDGREAKNLGLVGSISRSDSQT